MKVRFWGTRGSLPVAQKAASIGDKIAAALVKADGRKFADTDAARAFAEAELDFATRGTYGGATSCVEVEAASDDDAFIVCDLGSGLREFGLDAMGRCARGHARVYHVFLSHLHWDHICGFPFFVPVFDPNAEIVIHSGHVDAETALRRQQEEISFPVAFDWLRAKISFRTLEIGKPYRIGAVTVEMVEQHHSHLSYGYKFTDASGKSVVYSTDSEHKIDKMDAEAAFVSFFRHCDFVICDTMYSLADSISMKKDWGHSSNVVAIDLCHEAEARRLALFHHEPTYSDADIQRMHQESIRYEELTREATPLEVICAYDGLVVDVEPPASRRPFLGGPLGVVALGAVLGVLLSLLAGPSARQMLFDTWQRSAPRAIGNDVTVVMIDDPAVREVGPWPWPRSRLAQLVLSIARYKPKVIAFDVLFPEEDRFNPDGIARAYPDIDPALKAGIGRLPSLDSQFAGVIGQAPVLLARSGVPARSFGVKATEPGQLLVDPEIQGRLPAQALAWPGAVTAITDLDGAALAHAFINVEADSDGIYRRVPVGLMIGDRAMPGLAAELTRIKTDTQAIAWHGKVATIGPITLRTDATATLPLRFGNFPEAHIVSAASAMAPDSRETDFAGKVVIIGLGTEGSVDLSKTPLETTFGVLVQAQAVDAMLHHGWLERPLWIEFAEWGLALGLVLLIAKTGRRRRWAFAVAAGGALLLMPVSWALFTGPGLLFDPLRPLFVAIGAAAAAVTSSYVLARVERTRLANELVASQMAAALQEGELQAARGIQLGMVPTGDRLAKLDPRIDAAAMLEPARSVGGDFFDAFRVEDGRLIFVIADVTGKGVPAALFMAVSKTLAKSVLTREQGGLAHAIETLNAELLRESDDSMGVTMLVVLVDCASGELTMVNAGHENPVLRRADGSVAVVPMEGGPPFCVMDFPYPEERLTLAAGETLVLITDGVTEAQNEAGALFGIDGALAWLRAARGTEPAAIVEGLMRAVRGFEEPAEPADDLTVMAIRYTGAKP